MIIILETAGGGERSNFNPGSEPPSLTAFTGQTWFAKHLRKEGIRQREPESQGRDDLRVSAEQEKLECSDALAEYH